MSFADTLTRLRQRYGEDACWIWPGYKDRHGRGRTTGGELCHRRAYRELVGPIPDGAELDHLCRTMGCCNPGHMESVTHRENLRRGDGFAGQHARALFCKHGHEFTPENTIYPYRDHPEWRRCLTCSRRLCNESQKRYRRERNAYKREWKRRHIRTV